MKALFYRKTDDRLMKDKPEGEILFENQYTECYLFGIRLYRNDYNFICNIQDRPKNAGFK